MNVGKTKGGHEVINQGVLSPEFAVNDPFHHHKTFDVGAEDTDYFYLSSSDIEIKVDDVDIQSSLGPLLSTAYRLDYQNQEAVIALIYMCNPILPLKINIKMSIIIRDCGKVIFSWIKSCGDLTLPLDGLNVYMIKEDDSWL